MSSLKCNAWGLRIRVDISLEVRDPLHQETPLIFWPYQAASVLWYLFNTKRYKQGDKANSRKEKNKTTENEKNDEMRCHEHEQRLQPSKLQTANNRHCKPHQKKLHMGNPITLSINMSTNKTHRWHKQLFQWTKINQVIEGFIKIMQNQRAASIQICFQFRTQAIGTTSMTTKIYAATQLTNSICDVAQAPSVG